jgi:hypothetical protein
VPTVGVITSLNADYIDVHSVTSKQDMGQVHASKR